MKTPLCLVAALAVPAALLAQDAPPSDMPPELVVTATRQPTIAARQPYWAAVLDRDELSDGESLADVLAHRPEVYVQMPGGRSGFASVFLRGADPNFTSVLLEGVPLNSPANSRGGAVNVAALSAAAIGRVEIVAGAVTTLFGSGPLAGAINLLLAPPSANSRATLAGSLGSEGEATLLGRLQGPLALGWGGSLSAVWDDAGAAPDRSSFRSRSLDLRLAPLPGGSDRLLVHLADTKARSFPDSSGGLQFAEIRQLERRRSDEVVLAADKVLARRGPARLAIAASYFTRGDATDSPGVAPAPISPTGVPAGSDAIRYRNTIVRPQLALEFAVWNATLGVEGSWERARSRGYLDFGSPVSSDYDARRATYSGFAELGYAADRLSANAGIRVSDIEGIGTRVTARGGVRYLLLPDLSLRASAGNAFKAPSFYALANPFVGNPTLRPEEGGSLEAGIDWDAPPGSRLSLTAFRSRYRDLIDFIPGDVPRLENRARVSAEGVSATFTQRLGPKLRAEGGVQYVVTRDAQSGEQLLNRPRWRGSAMLAWQALSELELRARYAFTDERSDFAIPTGVVTLGPTHQASLGLEWGVTRDVRLSINAENLLNERAGDAVGFSALPRRLRIGLTHSLSR